MSARRPTSRVGDADCFLTRWPVTETAITLSCCLESQPREGMVAMSYPDKVYFGSAGEVSANFRAADTPPDLGAPGDGIHYLATTELTRGEYGLYRVMMKPRAGGPSTHFHRTISESFYVLEGTIRLFNGEKWIE